MAFGDSITDGTRSTPDPNNRWPDLLVARMLAQPSPRRMGVLNSGIAGNRVLSEGVFTAGINALARFDADVLTQSGVTHVLVLEGINDIGNARQNATPTAEDIIAGHKQLIERGRSQGAQDHRGDTDAVLGRRLLHRCGRSEATGRQSMDSNQWRLRCGRRFRSGNA